MNTYAREFAKEMQREQSKQAGKAILFWFFGVPAALVALAWFAIG
jgi:hypothetical protein